MMTAKELSSKKIAELQAMIVELKREHFNLRMQKGSQQLAKSHLLKQARRNIARINTVMHQKQQSEAQS